MNTVLEVQVTLFPERPTIDGVLDDAVWQRAARLTDFVQTQPGDNTRPTRGTEVLLGYDAHALYIGVLAADEPGKVRATVAKRDDVLRRNGRVFFVKMSYLFRRGMDGAGQE